MKKNWLESQCSISRNKFEKTKLFTKNSVRKYLNLSNSVSGLIYLLF